MSRHTSTLLAIPRSYACTPAPRQRGGFAAAQWNSIAPVRSAGVHGYRAGRVCFKGRGDYAARWDRSLGRSASLCARSMVGTSRSGSSLLITYSSTNHRIRSGISEYAESRMIGRLGNLCLIWQATASASIPSCLYSAKQRNGARKRLQAR